MVNYQNLTCNLAWTKDYGQATSPRGYELSSTALLLALMAMYMIPERFLDEISMILLTLAVVELLVCSAGIDLIWLDAFGVLVDEMFLITRPMGLNLFLVRGMTGRDIGTNSHAAAPMFALMFISVVLLILFPDIALWLPETPTRKNWQMKRWRGTWNL